MSDLSGVSSVSGVSGTADAPKKRREYIIKYPATVSVAVTRPMYDSIMRLCPKNSIGINQSTFLRQLLDRVLLTIDPVYAREKENL
jgi:hypothetical protein